MSGYLDKSKTSRNVIFSRRPNAYVYVRVYMFDFQLFEF